MLLINCKTYLEINWNKNCVMYGADDNAGSNDRVTTLQIKSTKLYVPIVTLSTKNIVNLTKELNEGFKRSVYWNEGKLKIERKEINENRNSEIFPLDSSFQEVNGLFVLDFDNTKDANRVQRDIHRKYFLPGANITNYNVLIHSRNFYDQPINDQIKKYDEIRKITTGKGDDYTTGYLLDYQYFKE